MYTVIDFNSKKELVEAFKAGAKLEVYQPGPFGPEAKDGRTVIEGPHYPRPHKFYVSVEVQNGIIVKINK